MLLDFISTFSKRGFSRPDLFKVEITRYPDSIEQNQGVIEVVRDIPMFADTAEIPGVQIMTTDHRHYDITQKFAYMKAHDDLNVQFRLDADMQIKKFFDLWVDSIYNRQTGDVKYKNTYTGTVAITQMRADGSVAHALEFQEAFPVTVGQISLGWDQQGQFSKLPVTFSYRRINPLDESVMEKRKNANSIPSKTDSSRLKASQDGTLSPVTRN